MRQMIMAPFSRHVDWNDAIVRSDLSSESVHQSRLKGNVCAIIYIQRITTQNE